MTKEASSLVDVFKVRNQQFALQYGIVPAKKLSAWRRWLIALITS